MAKVSTTSNHGNRSWTEWWRAGGKENLLLTDLWQGRAAQWGIGWDAEAWQHVESWREVGMAPERQG